MCVGPPVEEKRSIDDEIYPQHISPMVKQLAWKLSARNVASLSPSEKIRDT
jgi:hypothetical protein